MTRYNYLSAVLSQVTGNPWGNFGHWCPACLGMHEFAVDQPNPSGAKWTFDGNILQPTFAPSMNIRIGPYSRHVDGAMVTDVCHYFLQTGMLIFTADSTHKLAGQIIELPVIPMRISSYYPLYLPPE